MGETIRATGHRNSLVVSESGEGNLTPEAISNVDNFREGVDDDGNWDFDGVIGVESAHPVGKKLKLLDMQDECRTEKERFPTNVAEAVELAQELLGSTDVHVNTVPPSEIPVTTGGDIAELTAELDKAKFRINELVFVEPFTIRWHGELWDEVKQRHAKEVSNWNDKPAGNADSLISDVKLAKVDSVKMSVERNLISNCFEKHVRALQDLVNAKVEWKVTLTDAMTRVRERLEIVRSISK